MRERICATQHTLCTMIESVSYDEMVMIGSDMCVRERVNERARRRNFEFSTKTKHETPCVQSTVYVWALCLMWDEISLKFLLYKILIDMNWTWKSVCTMSVYIRLHQNFDRSTRVECTDSIIDYSIPMAKVDNRFRTIRSGPLIYGHPILFGKRDSPFGLAALFCGSLVRVRCVRKQINDVAVNIHNHLFCQYSWITHNINCVSLVFLV